MDGFTDLEDTGVLFKAVSFRTWITVTWGNRTKLEKGLMLAIVALVLLAVGLTVGLAVSLGKGDNQTHEPSTADATLEPSTADVCLSAACTKAASRVLESMDQSVDPCTDFYTYACGAWQKTHVIPEDSISISVFSVLREKIQLINKNLYEDPGNLGLNEEAWRKAKDMYASCMDTELIEMKNLSVVIQYLEEFGGWPILGTSPGGYWNEADFNLVNLLVNLRQYGFSPLIALSVHTDLKQTDRHSLYLEIGSQEHFHKDDFRLFAASIAVLFGADSFEAALDIIKVSELEIELKNMKLSSEETEDPNVLYNNMILSDLKKNFTEPNSTASIQFSWEDYVFGVMNLDDVKVAVSDKEPLVVTAVPYFQRLFGVLQKFEKRTITNYLIWPFIHKAVPSLPQRFREVYNRYIEKSLGTGTISARWRECEDITTLQMGMIISQKFIAQEFDVIARIKAKEMVDNIRKSFDELLQENEWMDEHTRGLAEEKAKAIKSWIGYPDDILDNDHMNRLYQKVVSSKTEFLKNIFQNLKTLSAAGLRKLRQPYNKTSDEQIWSSPPTTVNAFYFPQRNDITIPVGILHSPFYVKDQPKSLNYGSLGTIIGHEITHGFDNEGRRFNKDGNFQHWWKQDVINRFIKQAQCMVDQYSGFQFNVSGIIWKVDGNLTLGENIADNGGLKQSYKAYRRWVQEKGEEEPKLPGLNLTHAQLFFVGFAQNWCTNAMPLALKLELVDEHSPEKARVIVSLQNSKEFAHAYSCPSNSYMNPVTKCHVW